MTNSSAKSAGTLRVVATPLGNLADISPRAREALVTADLVAAEDTRRSARLLAHLGSEKPQVSLHEHNEDAQIAGLLDALGSGKNVALVSDAGTPLISDPGFRLVRAASDAGFPVVGIPGPSAVTLALSIAGIATDRFVFEGFLPRRAGQRRARLEALRDEPRTLVLFESVHRFAAVVGDLRDIFGAERRVVVARELTKLHEQVYRGTLEALAGALGSEVPLLGEFVVVIAGADEAASGDDAEVRRVYALLVEELPPDRAVALAAKICGRSRNEVYALTRRD